MREGVKELVKSARYQDVKVTPAAISAFIYNFHLSELLELIFLGSILWLGKDLAETCRSLGGKGTVSHCL